jgi:hypothetical protein
LTEIEEVKDSIPSFSEDEESKIVHTEDKLENLTFKDINKNLHFIGDQSPLQLTTL